ncbi:helix-turn-helix domain-containing protein [Cohnella zeiphila]|uniref:Helix-turn-helix transcriptional regulator n=1 Tax=Cohnella zeiphila TaxID=2761120 RepID=A0A7X0VWE1_9BACL|nr:AraC family transcriptional regulator [Cohnella zeiphila]MBB6730853.1 helix-turn-helix transcriptional regulator [Cohnella zeiphila]
MKDVREHFREGVEEQFQEPIHYQNRHLCIKAWQFTDRSEPGPPGRRWHYHKEVELVLVQEGAMNFHTPGHSYALDAGDVAIVGSSQLHLSQKTADGPLVYIVLHVDLQRYFDPAMMMYYRHFSELVRPLEELNYIFQESAAARREMAGILTDIHEEMIGRRNGYEIAASMHIKHLLLTLLRHDSRGLLQSNEFVDDAVMRPVLDFVDRHLSERIDMDEASRIARMNYSYFSKYFKKAVGVSFVDYVNRQRIRKAAHLLVAEPASVSAIAASVGIENMAHFYELFKRYNGCTPKEYARRLLRGEDGSEGQAGSKSLDHFLKKKAHHADGMTGTGDCGYMG